MARRASPKIGRTPSGFRRMAVPIGMTMIGSLFTLIPFIAVTPLMPPAGLLIFLAWRALHRHIWPVWIGVPLGLWDDLFSGAVIGSAVLMWTIILIGYEIVDRRMIWRDFNHEWSLAAIVIIITSLSGLILSGLTGGALNPVLIVPQIVISLLAFPLITRLCGFFDEWRLS